MNSEGKDHNFVQEVSFQNQLANCIKLKHPEYGFVMFEHPTPRQREMLRALAMATGTKILQDNG